MAVITTKTEQRTGLGDLALYGLSAGFAGLTALTSTLTPHRAWGQVAFFGYCAAALITLLTIRSAGLRARTWLTAVTFAMVALVPLIAQAVQRADGRTDRAQEEVVVVEHAATRLFRTGTPYLSRDAIETLPPDERLLGYTPYQPGMALFGAPRALLGDAWWSDARIWFAVVTIAALVLAGRLLRGFPGPGLLRAGQAATVLPICALTLATGGDDLPVLALCLLAIALAANARFTASGLAIGAASALKLFAWPVALVLLAFALREKRWSVALGAFGLPALALLPALAVDADALVENVVRFPSGHGLVTSPAQSPLPGYLIASYLPGGRGIALGLLLLGGVAMAWWLLRHPPATAATVALISAVGLTLAILLTPATRFGYLLYPIAFAALWLAVRSPGRALGRTQGA